MIVVTTVIATSPSARALVKFPGGAVALHGRARAAAASEARAEISRAVRVAVLDLTLHPFDAALQVGSVATVLVGMMVTSPTACA